MVSDRLQSLWDRQCIYDRVAQYCRAGDTRDLALAKDCYWPEATDDHGIYSGNAHAFIDAAMTQGLEQILYTQHVLGQVYVELNGDSAEAESYLVAYHRVSGDRDVVRAVLGDTYLRNNADEHHDTHDWIGGGRWFDRFERRGEEWRIIARRATTEWSIASPTSRILSESILANPASS
jgi:hypothetical protein